MRDFRAVLVLGLAFLVSWGVWSIAGQSNYHATPGTGLVFDSTTDSGGNLVPNFAICDGVVGAPCADVKAGSTAAVPSDQAAVVAISPNSNGVSLTTTTPVIISGTPSVNVNGIGALPPVTLAGTPSVLVNGIGTPITIGSTPSVGLATNTEPALAAVSSLEAITLDRAGKPVTSPYATRELMLRGANTATSTTLATIISAQAGYHLYITDVECGRTDAGATAITVTFNDTVSTPIVLPNNGGGGAWAKAFNVPLVVATGVTFQYAMSTNTTSVPCAAQGFYGY